MIKKGIDMRKPSIIQFIKTKMRVNLLNNIVIGIGIVLLILGLKIYISEYSQAKASTALALVPSPITNVLPFESVASPSKDYLVTCAEESAEKNEDVIGWIRIEGTLVDYPVVQTQDDVYYLKHDAENNESRQGAIFLDYRCSPVSLTGNNILFGHNMKDGSMFASLVQYKDEAFFKSHTMIEFATLEKTYEWEIFAVVITDTNYDYLQTDFTSREQRLGFIRTMQEKSIYETVIAPSGTDDLLILSTCTYEYKNARFVIAARRMQ